MSMLKIASLVTVLLILCITFLISLNFKSNLNLSPKIASTNLQEMHSNQVSFKNIESEKYATVQKKYVTVNLQNKIIPTNRIWSSVPFDGSLKGLYLFPVVAKVDKGVLLVTVPQKHVTEKLIASQIENQYLKITANQPIDKVYLDDFSDMTLTLEFRDSLDRVLFKGVFTQGSPFFTLYPKGSDISIEGQQFNLKKLDNNALFSSTVESNKVNFSINSQNTFEFSDTFLNIKAQKNKDLPINVAFFDNENSRNTILKYEENYIKSIYINPNFDSSKIVSNIEIVYEDFAKNKKTILGFLPHQYTDNKALTENSVMTVNTLRGEQKFKEVGSKLEYSTPQVEMSEQLDIDPNLIEKNKDLFTSEMEKDVIELSNIPNGSYFAGKYLAKVARLLQISYELKLDSQSSRLQQVLKAQLEDWLTYSGKDDTQYFSYDHNVGGIIASNPEFGLEQYNDHHFHYGYFIQAAAVLGKHDAEFLEKNKDVVNLLIQDVAGADRSNTFFPYIRGFDFYEGHSWASGFQPFADGNNQESTSEAINAWYSIWLWSNTVNDQNLSKLASYLYSSEINSAKHYWLNTYNNSTIFPDSYTSQTASLVWGGKIEYNTFFSGDPLAIEAIQYLPFTPGSKYLYNPQKINQRYQVNKKYLSDKSKAWLDLNYMYFEMNPDIPVPSLAEILGLKIDNGNSRGNMIYWYLYWQSKK